MNLQIFPLINHYYSVTIEYWIRPFTDNEFTKIQHLSSISVRAAIWR